jgi:hypothetical protein
MILPFFTLGEYARLTRPSVHRFDLSSVRACGSVLPFTFGTTQRTAAGAGGGGGGAGGGGGGGAGAWHAAGRLPSARRALSLPPVIVFPANDPSASTLELRIVFSCAAVHDGDCARSRAATPATCGVAIEVPANGT